MNIKITTDNGRVFILANANDAVRLNDFLRLRYETTVEKTNEKPTHTFTINHLSPQKL